MSGFLILMIFPIKVELMLNNLVIMFFDVIWFSNYILQKSQTFLNFYFIFPNSYQCMFFLIKILIFSSQPYSHSQLCKMRTISGELDKTNTRNFSHISLLNMASFLCWTFSTTYISSGCKVFTHFLLSVFLIRSLF